MASFYLASRTQSGRCGGRQHARAGNDPYPFYVSRAEGHHLWTKEGQRLIGYCLAYGPMILGHRHPLVMERVVKQLEQGWLYGTPSELEVSLAKRIVGHYPSIDMLRFVSTGTEATMAALRIARGYTGRDRIVKVEGGFHGAHDAVLVKEGFGGMTLAVPDRGMETIRAKLLTFPWQPALA